LVGCAVQRAGDGPRARCLVEGELGYHGEVLQVVGASVGIIVVICGDAVTAQVYSETCVTGDVVYEDGVPRAVTDEDSVSPLLKMMFLNILILRGPPMVLLDAPCICTPSPAFPKSCVPEVSVPM
jgi:hypothetical protein